MFGTIIGDIVGSTREFKPIKKTQFNWLPNGSSYTDDTILSLATADVFLSNISFVQAYRRWAKFYPNPKGAYGPRFKEWVLSESDLPYGSYGNGSAMRVGPVGWLDSDLDIILQKAYESAISTHSHPEGIKGAQCVAECIYYFRRGEPVAEVILSMSDKYGYDVTKSLAEIRPDYRFDETCQGTIPAALRCVLESLTVEQAIRNAISLGGDADTLAAIAGSMAEAAFPPDYSLMAQALSYLPYEISNIVFQSYSSLQFGYSHRFDSVLINLLKNYKNADYEILWNNQSEKVKIDGKIVSNKTTIGIITAYNPKSIVISDEQNELRNENLKKDLDDLKCTYVKAVSHDPLEVWKAENGFAVLGLTKTQLIQLAKKYEQHAVVFLESGKPSELVWCS